MVWHDLMYWGQRVYYDEAVPGHIYVIQCVASTSLYGCDGAWAVVKLVEKHTSKFLWFTVEHVTVQDVDDGGIETHTLRWIGDYVLLRYDGDRAHPQGLINDDGTIAYEGAGASSGW